MHKHIVDSKYTTVELDGEKWTVVLLSLDYGSPEASASVSDRVHAALGASDQLITAIQHGDGPLGLALADPELSAKILARIAPVHQWKSVRLAP